MSCHGQTMRIKQGLWKPEESTQNSGNEGAKDNDNVILIGMPGAGKSTSGVVLAKVLGYDFIDVDLLIQKKHDKTLQTLIDERGPEAFIALEGEVLESLGANEPIKKTVIATGGSAVYSDAGMRHLVTLGQVVYLQVSYEELVSRLGNLDERGVVFRGSQPQTDLRALYDERAPLYQQYAHTTVVVDNLSIAEASQRIKKVL